MGSFKLTQINRNTAIFTILALLLVTYFGNIIYQSFQKINDAIKNQEKIMKIGIRMESTSDTLSEWVRQFTINHHKEAFKNYWYEVETLQNRDYVIQELIELDLSEQAKQYLFNAKEKSDALIKKEVHAMLLIINAMNYEDLIIPTDYNNIVLSEAELLLSKEKKLALARQLVFDFQYQFAKDEIRSDLAVFRQMAEENAFNQLSISLANFNKAFQLQLLSLLIIFIIAGILMFFLYKQTVIPIINYTRTIKNYSQGDLPLLNPQGAHEIKALAVTFNKSNIEKTKFETALKESEYKLKLHLQLMPLAAIEFDKDFFITGWNPEAERIFGYINTEIIGKNLFKYIVPKNMQPEIMQMFSSVNAIEKAAFININKNITKEGKTIICEWHNTTLFDSVGNIMGWIAMIRDITTQKMEEEHIIYLSRHDPLTGLYNRRYFYEKLNEEKARVQRNKKPFTIMMLDIDFFKKFNDNYGHECGDQVLISVAQLMQSSVRKTDFVGRWGGEEFIILLPETDINGGFILAEKIRENIAAKNFKYDDMLLKITVTIGIAACDGGFDLEDCIRRADEALLQGKAMGRNRVVQAKSLSEG